MVVGALTDAGSEWLASIVPALASSVDRLAQVPERLHTIFSFDAAEALAHDGIRAELSSDGGRRVVAVLAQELEGAARLTDREPFRALANRVKETSGQKGKALFHPIRAVLTGEAQGPELDLLVPAIDRATILSPADGLQAVTGCRERARRDPRRANPVTPPPTRRARRTRRARSLFSG